jgi:hypothetical protein
MSRALSWAKHGWVAGALGLSPGQALAQAALPQGFVYLRDIDPTIVQVAPLTEGNTDGRDIASAQTARRGRRHWHVRTLLAREPGDPTSDHRRVAGLARIGKARSRSR